jgi:hypothetical protein
MVKTTTLLLTNCKSWKGESKTWYFNKLIKQYQKGILRNGIGIEYESTEYDNRKPRKKKL